MTTTGSPFDLKLFSDAYDTLKKIFGDAASIAKIPKAERDHFRRVLDDTFTLFDSAILLVYNRLGDILLRAQGNDQDKHQRVTKELRALVNYPAWEKLNRDVRLCQNLRETSREMTTLIGTIKKKLGIKDTNALNQLIPTVLEGEDHLANHIGNMLKNLGDLAPLAKTDLPQVEQSLKQALESLRKERRRLIKLQLKVIKAI